MMNRIYRLFFIFSLFITGMANADVVRLEQVKDTTTTVEQPFIVSSSNIKIYVTSGTGKSVRVFLKNQAGEPLLTQTKGPIDINDKFVIDGVSYYGYMFELNGIRQGMYTIVVQKGILDVANQFTTNEYPLTVDLTAPEIKGAFFWNSASTAYWRIHDDGKFVISTAGARDAGFSGVTTSISGFASATFSAVYVDGPNAGKTHAKNLPALVTEDGRVIIGQGVDNSISSAYVPSNTAARMKFTFKVVNKAGLSTEKTEELYVANRPVQSKPQPYGVFTGVATALDGISAFRGFVPYTPGMTITTNPVRMIYRANKSHYYGGGGDADIYGGWVNSTRNLNRLVYSDAQYLYFDVAGSTDGTRINEQTYFVRDLSTWRQFYFEHSFTLDESIKSPEATEIAYFQNGANRWFSGAPSLVTYITKDNTSGLNDAITKIRITVKPRAYNQRFNYDFQHGGPRYQGSCIVPATQTQCTITTNLPYPGDDISTYHNRHLIMGVGNSLLSPEIISDWRYDGSPAVIEPSSIVHDAVAKTISFTVKKDFVTRVWGSSLIRSVKLFAAPQNNPSSRLNVSQTKLDSVQVNGSQVNSYTFSYSNLSEGTYTFYAKVEDGFGNTLYQHKREHKVLEGVAFDFTPPVITTNIGSSPVTSLTAIQVSLSDASNAYVQSMLLTGGAENIKFALPFSSKGVKKYSPEYIFLNPSEDKPFTLAVTALDQYGNKRISFFNFIYQPQLTRMQDTKLPAIASPLRDENGVPHNVLLTPQIRNSDGAPAKGNHKVYFSLSQTAQTGLKVNDVDVAPGQTAAFNVNLSATNHRLRLVLHPLQGGTVTENSFQLHVPDIKVALCPEGFEESGTSCIYLHVKPANVACPSGFSQTENGLACQKLFSYQPKTECAAGYSLDNLTCKGTYTTTPIVSCPSSFGLADGGTSCNRTTTQAVKLCPDGQSYEDGMCKDSVGNASPTSVYCNGIDVSKAPSCQNGTCTSFNEEWNACVTTTRTSTSQECPSGTLTNGVCVVVHSYNLNASCPFGYNREGLNCTRLEIVDPIKSCDSGWEQISTGCVKQDYAAFQSCPPTHIFKDGRCHEKAEVIINCPSTYTWNGTACVRQDNAPATPVCPTGYSWSVPNSRCEQVNSQPATPICPTGYTWSAANSRCEQTNTQPATPVCPAGYAWSASNSRCEKTDTQVATPVCPSGYSWSVSNSRCEKTDTQVATPVCPSGYSWSVSNSRCEKTDTQAATPVCPSGYTWTAANSRCEKTDTQPATPECPSGYSWSAANSRCEQTNTQPATPVCPAGYAWSASNSRCEKTDTQPATPVCPSGYSWSVSNSRCEQTNIQPATPVCSTGYSWSASNSRCEMTTTQQATINCPSGYNWSSVNSRCELTDTQQATPVCATGYSWSSANNRCEMTNTQPATVNCPSGYTWTPANNRCELTNTQPATPVCATGFSWSSANNQCEKSETQPASIMGCKASLNWEVLDPQSDGAVQCSSNLVTSGHLLGGNCYYGSKLACEVDGSCVSQSQPANNPCHDGVVTPYNQEKCPLGWTLSSGQCNRTLTDVPSSYSCQSGWSLVGTTCSQLQIASATYSCASGWTLSGSTCSQLLTQGPSSYSCQSGWSLSGTTCSQLQTTSPTYSCGTGWSLTGSTCSQLLTQGASSYSCPTGWSVSGSSCTQVQTSSPSSYSCPTGWVVSGSTCTQLQTSTPSSYSCPTGWVVSGSSCTQLQTSTPSSYSCPTGWVVSGSSCTQLQTTSPSSYTCPTGWVVSGSSCTQLQTTSPSSYTCPTGWVVSGSSCTQLQTTSPSSYTCPTGWVVSGSSCTQLLTTSPSSYTCTAGWSVSGSTCTRIDTSNPSSYTCPPDWSLNNKTCNQTVFSGPDSYKCDSGWSLVGQACTRQATETETRTCKSSFVLQDPQTCVGLLPSDFVGNCQSGWTVMATRCMLETSKDFNLSCNTGFDLIEQTCRRTLNQPVTVNCQSGETLVDGQCASQITVPLINTCDSPYALVNKQCRNRVEINNFDQI